MQAVILVGGQGTRLRPLTINTPKPLLPLVNRPFLDYVLDHLRAHGIRDVVFAMGYRSENFAQAYGDGSHLNMRLTYVHEEEPLGTGGAIKNVETALSPGETFLVFNGDVLTDLDLTDMLRLHRERRSICTISLTPVEDPSAYGVVDIDEAGRIERFTEKPKREEATSNWINAGTYILEPELLQEIPQGEHYMVERGLFPTLLQKGRPLYGYRSAAYWMDIGTPAKYIHAHADLLMGRMKSSLQPEGDMLFDGVVAGEGTFIHKEAMITGPVVMGSRCHVDAGAVIIGPVVLGDGCRLEQAAQLANVVAWHNVRFGPRSESRDCILATGAQLGADSHIEGQAIIGEGTSAGQHNHLASGIKIAPGVTLPDGAITF